MTSNQEYIENRIIEVANYIITSKSTIRETAKKFGVSKSTVHKDLVVRLPRLNTGLAKDVKQILQFNMDERHIRGGISTKLRYQS